MEHPIARDERASTVRTSVWTEEHDWLHQLYKSPSNTSPKFRIPDLLSACVALVLSQPENQRLLVEYLTTRHALRDPRCPGRSCEIFPAQFEQVLDAHRAAWNRFPNPMFEIEHILTGCVAVTMSLSSGGELVLRQARDNLIARSKATGASVN
jgi:hypothetical protein